MPDREAHHIHRVINYCDDLRDGNTAVPQNYWVNTSSNDIIRNFVKKANPAASPVKILSFDTLRHPVRTAQYRLLFVLSACPNSPPTNLNYWVNTSSNDIIRNFVKKANPAARNEIEQLISGGSIQKEIHQELTYRDLDADLDHLWSILFMTGYLTKRLGRSYPEY